MTARWIPLLIWSIIVYGSIAFRFINSYQKVKQTPQIRYHLLPDTSLPDGLSDLARQGTEAGFRYLGTYSITLPPAFRRKHLNGFLFQNDQSTSTLILNSSRGIKSASYQTIFEDGALLVTTTGVPQLPLMRVRNNDHYQVHRSKGNIAETQRLHESFVAEWIPIHGKPDAASSPQAYLDRMNQFVGTYGHQQVARSTANMFRITAYVLSGLYFFIMCLLLVPMVAPGSPPSVSTILGTVGITSIASILIIGSAVILQYRIRRDFLHQS